MTRLKRLAIAAVAAATVTVGSLAAVPTAQAALSCDARWQLHWTYWTNAWAFASIGNWYHHAYWWGRAEAIVVGC